MDKKTKQIGPRLTIETIDKLDQMCQDFQGLGKVSREIIITKAINELYSKEKTAN